MSEILLNQPLEKISMDKTDVLYIQDNLNILIGMWIEENYPTKADEEKIKMLEFIKQEIQVWIDWNLNENSTVADLKKIRWIEYKYHDIIDYKQERSQYGQKIQNVKSKIEWVIKN